jgi:hypothetical protein
VFRPGIEGYLIAPLADHMLQANPELAREFNAKLATDPAFDARLAVI